MFRESIKRTVERLDEAGGAAALLMGFDGIPVESYVGPGATDVQTISAELTHIIAGMRRSADGAGFGVLREMTVKTDKLALIIQLVTKDYFLALGMSPDGNLGKARYLLRLLAPQIRSEL